MITGHSLSVPTALPTSSVLHCSSGSRTSTTSSLCSMNHNRFRPHCLPESHLRDSCSVWREVAEQYGQCVGTRVKCVDRRGTRFDCECDKFQMISCIQTQAMYMQVTERKMKNRSSGRSILAPTNLQSIAFWSNGHMSSFYRSVVLPV